MVSGMAAAAELAGRHWDGVVERLRAGGDVSGFTLDLTPTTLLVVDAGSIRVVRDDGSVAHAQPGVPRGLAIEVCAAAAATAVDFWRELESGVGRAEVDATIVGVLGPELGAQEPGSVLDARLVHLVVRLHRERALAFHRAVWGEDPVPVDPDRTAPAEAVVVGEPIVGADQAFFLPIPPEGAADPLWRRAAELGAETGSAWRRDHAPREDAALDLLVADRVRAAFRLPAVRWVVAAAATVVLVVLVLLPVLALGWGIPDPDGARTPVAVVGLVGLAVVALVVVLLYRAALREHRRRRDERRWAVQVAVHRAHEAARTWRTSRVRWSAGDLE